MIRILIVDDNYNYVKLLRSFFATTEIDAHIATSADDALDAIKKCSFDLLLTDMKMPGIDGIDLTIRVKENDKEMPIIMITSYLSPDTAARAADVGISKVLDKGVPLPELARNVRVHARDRHASEKVFSGTQRMHVSVYSVREPQLISGSRPIG